MDTTTDNKHDAEQGTRRRSELEPGTQSPSDPSIGGVSPESDAAEAPAAEGLLLLQHVAETVSDVSRSSLRRDPQDDVASKDPDLEPTHVNPIHELLRKGVAMRVTDEVEELRRFRGVFVLSRLPVYYSLIELADRFHFLGFHASPLAAAQAWDLAALKRAMDSSQNLSIARTNFRLEDYVKLENVLSMMVVLRFEELVEVFREAHQSLAVTSEDDGEVQKVMEACKQSFPDELGSVPVPPDFKSDPMGCPAQTLSADEMRDLIAATCVRGSSATNSWVRNIRDSKKWKGVYFSKDGVPYSKVEFDGKSQYLGRFDTIEAAARAYDLATLKRAMAHHESTVALNFPKEDYIRDKQLMEFLFLADDEQVSHFIRMLAQNQRTSSVGDHYLRGRSANKRQKLDGASSMSTWSRKPVESSVQHIDWKSLGLGKPSSAQFGRRSLLSGEEKEDRGDPMEEVDEEASELSKKKEMQVERRICDANMAALVKESTDWVRVALNAVALRMTLTNINITTEHVTLPGVVTEWFGTSASDVMGPHAVEMTNACGKQSFHFICCVSKDQCRFSATAWNQFVEEIGLSVGDILVLLKSNSCWKLSYAVFVLPDALMAENFAQSVHHGGPRFPKLSGMYVPPAATVRPSTAAPPAPNPTRRTLQAHVLSNAQNLTNIQVLQKTQDGRLLVEAGLLRDFHTGVSADPTKRCYFVIPANSVQPAPVMRPPSGFVGGPSPQPFPAAGGNKRFLPGSLQNPHPGTSRMQRPLRPACLPSTPIRLNIRGGFKALAKKSDSSLFMVTDSNGQMRLVTTQPQHPTGQSTVNLQPAAFTNHSQDSEPAVGYPTHFFAQEGQRTRPNVADMVSQTSPEITVIDPSTTGSDASGTGTEKPNAQQEEHSSQKQVIDLVEDEDKEPETTEKQADSLPDMYSHITKILEKCEGLDADVMKKYKIAFVNKMNQGQQTANFMELKSLSQAGEWLEVNEWIKSTVESLT